MTPKHRLDAALTKARAEEDPAAARATLDALAADPALATLPPVTALGLNRRLHATLLHLAKRTEDPVARLGLQALLVPPPDLLARFAAPPHRRTMAAAQAAPVPRILHQIWIGPRPPPPTLPAWETHAAAQGYTHKVWREADIAALGLPADPVYAARLAARDYPGATDAARYAILARHGGIYLDADWFPARNDIGFHDITPLTGLIAMAEPAPRATSLGTLLLANSIIMAPPAHPALTRLAAILAQVEAALPGAPAWWTTGPLIYTLIARMGPLTLLDATLVADTLPQTATMADAKARAARATTQDQGLLLAWKPW
ncbi:MAG: glycosyltransferase [Gemmobacter sp.]